MSEVERMTIDANRVAAAEAAGAKVTAVPGLSFPLAAEAQAGLEEFKAGRLAVLILSIERETLVQRGSAVAVDALRQKCEQRDPVVEESKARTNHEKSGHANHRSNVRGT